MMCSVSRLPISPAWSLRRRARKLGSKRRLKPRKKRALASAAALEAEIERLLAEDRLARRHGLQALREMLVGGTRDDHAGDGRIGERALESGRRRAAARGKRAGAVRERIDDIFQRQRRMRRRIGRMDPADASGTDQRDSGAALVFGLHAQVRSRVPRGRRVRPRRSARGRWVLRKA